MTGVLRGGSGAADLLRLLARGLSLTEIARRQGVGRPELARELLRLAEGLEQDASRPGGVKHAAAAGPRAGASPALVAYTDGASRGNPGPAGIGVVLLRDGQVLAEKGQPIGQATNNVAEYRAVIAALEMARTYGARRLEVRVDSELVARQLGGR